jgi:transposase-like protein
MKSKKQEQKVKYRIAPIASKNPELHKYEESFKRWLAQQIANGRMTIQQAAVDFNVPHNFVWKLTKKYADQLLLTLPVMTEEEKKKLEKQQQRIKELEKQLEDAQVKNIALETLIDVAEKDLKIDIRKKPGAKQ